MTKQVMEQALEALRRTLPYLRVAARRAASPDGYNEAKADLDAAESAIAALNEAIKQAGEPVGEVVADTGSLNDLAVIKWISDYRPTIGDFLYTSAPTIQKGWRLVPEEPTDKWIKQVVSITGLKYEISAKQLRKIIAAAPSYQGDKP